MCTGFVEIPGLEGYIKVEINHIDQPHWMALGRLSPTTTVPPVGEFTVLLHEGEGCDCGREGFTARAICVREKDVPFLRFFGRSAFAPPR